jgi:hypothetical protein
VSKPDVEKLMQAITCRFREKAVFPVGLQRYWEYEWVLRTLQDLWKAEATDLNCIVDVGCGDTELFTSILATENRWKVVACDPEPAPEGLHPTIDYRQQSAEDFCREVAPGLAIDAVVSVSVLEHCENRFAFCEALDSLPVPILLTCEFCRDDSDMAHCLVPLSVLTRCIEHMPNHYLARMEECPVWAENSRNGEWRPLAMLFLPMEVNS